jgi:hypothetical protein
VEEFYKEDEYGRWSKGSAYLKRINWYIWPLRVYWLCPVPASCGAGFFIRRNKTL